MREPDSPAALKARALRLLARREHSRAELAAKLAAHAPSPQILGSVLDELQSRQQLCDSRYAEERARLLARKYGAQRIRHDLRAKGIDDATAIRFTPANELERASAILARKYRHPARTLEERAKRARFLQSRGFAIDVIRRLLSSADPD